MSELAAALGVAHRTLRHRARTLPADAAGKHDGAWWFNPAYDRAWSMALARREADAPPKGHDPAAWTDTSVSRDAAIRRLVQEADENAAWLGDKGLSLTDADKVFCSERGIGYSTLQAYRRTITAGGSFPETRGRKAGARPPGKQAAALFLGIYQKPGTRLRVAWRMVAAKAARYPDDPAWHWPSEPTVRRWVKREHPPFYLDRRRKGGDAWRAEHEPKLDRAPLGLPGNHTWEIDASKSNFWAQHNGRKARPVYVLVRCVGSRRYVGHAVALTESTELYVRAMRRAAVAVGCPKIVRSDQGKALRGAGVGDANRRQAGVDWTEITGIVADMLAEFEPMTGRSGWQKGSVESAMNAVGMGFDALFPSYCGNRPENRPDKADKWADEHLDELPTLADVDRLLREFLEAENARPRSDLGRMSPLAKFNADAIEFRKVPDAVLSFRLLRAQRVKATSRGLAIRTGLGTVYYGQADQRVWELNGRELIARVNDDDLGSVLLCDERGRPLFYVGNDHVRGVTSEALREAGKRKQKARKAVREHWDNVDVAARPTVDEAIRLQREYAEMQAAKARKAEAPERGMTVLHSPFEEALKEAERGVLRRTGTDDTVETPTLQELLAGALEDGTDAVPDLSFDDLGAVREDVDDPMRFL